MTPTEKGSWRLMASLLRNGAKRLETQAKLGVAIDPEQISFLRGKADLASAIANEAEQPDLFLKRGGT